MAAGCWLAGWPAAAVTVNQPANQYQVLRGFQVKLHIPILPYGFSYIHFATPTHAH